MDSEREVQIHLAEFQALRDEVDHYSQRIDRMSGIYLTALFGIAGYLLRPESQFDIDAYIQTVQDSPSLTILFIFLAVLNSVLLIRIGSFFSGLLAIAQYVHYVIRPRLTALVGQEVIRWDEAPRLSAKKIWIPLRSLGQGLFIICQWRSKKGPPWRCKKGPLGGCGLVPVVHGRAPRATRRALNRLTRRRAREGPVGPRGQAWAGWSVQLAVGV